ncbi:protein-glutamate methylesterase [Erythrobacter litoralis HTCC2594]|uniref:Protein-glutamate methylesterase/protein-glutamine glutaminase n=2 Tax=Erythrobacter litoralis TaxID=39960 RepID=Q2N7J9_ERYLH|nr:protein-glutamate methylesterase [Erythrobacter litoralis HTCC2594]
MAVRVMIVDDSITARAALARAIDSSGTAKVVGTASSAEVALQLLREQRVDVILLDLEMPGMGGLEALPRLIEASAGAQILVVSSLTTAGAEPTLAAMAMGAADTLAKPRAGDFNEAYRAELLAKLLALAGTADTADLPSSPAVRPATRTIRPELIALGASTGGIHALGRFFAALPQSVTVPMVLTQHLPHSFMPVFARQVSAMAKRPAAIAADGELIRPNTVMIAPGHAHLEVRRSGGALTCALVKFPAPSGCCPSVDPMFESVANVVGHAGLGIVLSGMGRDGALGALQLDRAGGTVLAQNEDSCAVFGMPRGVVEAGIARAIEPPEALARYVANLAGVDA